MYYVSIRKVGAHLSSAGGHDRAVERVAAIGGNCLQLFSGSPRMWRRPKLEAIDVAKITTRQRELAVMPIFTHAPYLINLTAHEAELREKSLTTLSFELEFDAWLSGAGVVVHLGSHLGRGWLAVREELLASLTRLLQETPTSSRLLIENSAGQRGKLCSDLSEIKWLLEQLELRGNFVSRGRLGWCLDSCHAWAAGYPPARGARSLLQELTRLALFPTLHLIHLNDSRDEFGAGRDRHANLGEGLIPRAELVEFLAAPQLQAVPLVSEAPGFDGQGPDAENLRRLRELTDDHGSSLPS